MQHLRIYAIYPIFTDILKNMHTEMFNAAFH